MTDADRSHEPSKAPSGSLVRAGFVEFVGVPGSGKSTIASRLIKDGRFKAARSVLRSAVGSCLSEEVVKRPILAPFLSNELALRLWAGRPKRFLRMLDRENPVLFGLIMEWFSLGARDRSVSMFRHAEHLFTFADLVASTVLLRNYNKRPQKPVIIDEEWINFLTFKVSWGSPDEWREFSEKMINELVLPSHIVWFRDAASVSAERQRTRGKVASFFYGCENMERQAEEAEKRFCSLIPALSRRVQVIQVDARQPAETVAEHVIEKVLVECRL